MKEAREEERCEGCRYFRMYEVVREEDEGDGKCCYDPPRAIPFGTPEYFRSVFPDVLYGQWCRRWLRREGEMLTMPTEKE